MPFDWRTHYDSQKKTLDTTTSTQPRPQSSQCLVSDQAQDPPASTRAVQHAARVLIPGHKARMQKRKRSPRLLFLYPLSPLFRALLDAGQFKTRTAFGYQAVTAIAEEINRTTGLNPLQLACALRAVGNQGKAVSTSGTATLPVARVYPLLVTVRTLEHESHRLPSSALPHHFFTCFIRRRRLRIWL